MISFRYVSYDYLDFFFLARTFFTTLAPLDVLLRAEDVALRLALDLLAAPDEAFLRFLSPSEATPAADLRFDVLRPFATKKHDPVVRKETISTRLLDMSPMMDS